MYLLKLVLKYKRAQSMNIYQLQILNVAFMQQAVYERTDVTDR